MKKLIAALVMISALVFALPAAAGSRCDASADECIEKMKTKLAEKAWLGIDYDKAGHGRWSVKQVYANSPAEQAGFQAGDILIAMQGEDYTKENKKAIKAAWAKLDVGSDVQYVVKREGSKVKLNAVLAHVPQDLQQQWLAEYVQENHPEHRLASSN